MLSVKIGKETQSLSDKKVEAAVAGFLSVKDEMDLLNEKLKEHKEAINLCAKSVLEGSEAATVSLLGADGQGVKVTFGWDVSVSDNAGLKTLLGKRFNDLVDTQTVYKPVAKLKKMALEDDGLKECLTIKEKAPSVSVVR